MSRKRCIADPGPSRALNPVLRRAAKQALRRARDMHSDEQAILRLHSRKPLSRCFVRWLDQRSCSPIDRAQGKAGAWIYKIIWCGHASLRRRIFIHSGSALPRSGAEALATLMGIRLDRIFKSKLRRSSRGTSPIIVCACPWRSAARSDALQTRDRNGHRIWYGPGSAAHRQTGAAPRPGHKLPTGEDIA